MRSQVWSANGTTSLCAAPLPAPRKPPCGPHSVTQWNFGGREQLDGRASERATRYLAAVGGSPGIQWFPPPPDSASKRPSFNSSNPEVCFTDHSADPIAVLARPASCWNLPFFHS
ncbi:hypothetical protein Landi51_13584 [Colletotrichum acutatum]